ncbi:MAG: HAD family hydrolase, partial [Patescibacteria group bacterium]|nr:HAD family hydrolase [Patescibacteria group bacterium]
TLLDIDSFMHILNLFSLPRINDKTIIRWRRNGMIAKNIFLRLMKKKDRKLLETCLKTRLQYLARGGGGLGLVKEKKDARKVLCEIKQDGHFIVIVSSRKDRSIIKKILEKLGVKRYVDSIYCAENCMDLKERQSTIGLKVRLYRLALSDYKSLVTEKPIAVGNLKSDIVAAKKLKITPLAVRGSYRFDSGVSKGAKRIENLDHLLEFL